MWPLKKQNTDVDWSEFLKSSEPESRKQRLVRECRKYDVTPYVDDPCENASSNNVMRGVASEAEIERRLVAKKAMFSANRANIIALLAFFLALFSLGVSLYESFL
ncbi:hypothetical protein LL252_17710 [Alcanivorax marinus]|uniref:Uncharacterized protein n=1 Tax=Alloalcanivorax marinus TaxID=1177169 RepID=A0A9Q3UNU1_9GAMM|nr:hypothetical protein [Alloalcanivorax marinus]MCC4310407.1 hypothetical protein [Alloalcanivorax marinus]